MDDKDTKIAELQDQVDALSQERDKNNKSLESRIAELEKLIKTHGHEGPTNDGTKRLEKEINLLSGEKIGVGDVAAFTGGTEVGGGIDRTLMLFGTGRDVNEKDGSNNSQVYLEHQYHTDGSTNQTFFQGIRSPIYVGSDAIVASGSNDMSQQAYSWPTDSLVGAYVAVTNSAGSSFECYVITSNTANALEVDGTFTLGGNSLSYTIFIPIYLGSATFPWRRLYTMDGTAGGLRFGPGSTAGGQNGLLYSDTDGNLYYRDYAGTSTQLNGGGSGSGVTSIATGTGIDDDPTNAFTMWNNAGATSILLRVSILLWTATADASAGEVEADVNWVDHEGKSRSFTIQNVDLTDANAITSRPDTGADLDGSMVILGAGEILELDIHMATGTIDDAEYGYAFSVEQIYPAGFP